MYEKNKKYKLIDMYRYSTLKMSDNENVELVESNVVQIKTAYVEVLEPVPSERSLILKDISEKTRICTVTSLNLAAGTLCVAGCINMPYVVGMIFTGLCSVSGSCLILSLIANVSYNYSEKEDLKKCLKEKNISELIETTIEAEKVDIIGYVENTQPSEESFS